jgi:hypothetical protein
VTILDGAVSALFNEAKEYGADVSGTAVVNAPGAILKNMTIRGDLIIAEGVGSGDVTLDHVTVLGNTFVRGGGPDSIHITGGSSLAGITIEKTDAGEVRVVTSDGSVVDAVYVNDGSDDVILTGAFKKVTVLADVQVRAVQADIEEAVIAASGLLCSRRGFHRREARIRRAGDGASDRRRRFGAESLRRGGRHQGLPVGGRRWGP